MEGGWFRSFSFLSNCGGFVGEPTRRENLPWMFSLEVSLLGLELASKALTILACCGVAQGQGMGDVYTLWYNCPYVFLLSEKDVPLLF